MNARNQQQEMTREANLGEEGTPKHAINRPETPYKQYIRIINISSIR